MDLIKATYKIPSCKTVFFVISDSLCPVHIQKSPKSSIKTKGILSDDVLLTIRRHSRKYPRWTVRVMSESQFLLSIAQPIGIEFASKNPLVQNTENMKLLTINTPKTPQPNLYPSFHTPKILSNAPSEDIIEVFI